MKCRTILFVLSGLVFLTSFAPMAIAEDDSVTFPYMAQITQNNLNMRSGPGTNYYRCGNLNESNRVKVVSSRFSWSRVVPPAGSFSWISAQYVSLDPANPTAGQVTGDSVRVYAGSDYVKPEHSTTMQTKLDKGEKVTIIGEKQGDYYKIEPPTGAYLWVKTEYTKYIGPAEPVTPTKPVEEVKPAPEPVETDKPQAIIPLEKKAEPVKPEAEKETTEKAEPVKVEAVKETTEEVKKEAEPKAVEKTDGSVVETSLPVESQELKKYYELKKQIDDEKTKPLSEQNYEKFQKALTEIGENKKAGKAARYAKFSLDQIKRYELAMSVAKEMEMQNKQLEEAKEKIRKAQEAKLAENPDLGKYTVIGTLTTSNVYSDELKIKHYRIVDNAGNTICYGLPDKSAVDIDTTNMIDKKVGLVGKIEPHKQTSGALVIFTKIELLE